MIQDRQPCCLDRMQIMHAEVTPSQVLYRGEVDRLQGVGIFVWSKLISGMTLVNERIAASLQSDSKSA